MLEKMKFSKSEENANEDLTMANFEDFMNREEINLSRAAKLDDRVGASQKLTRDETPDSLVARVKYEKDSDRVEIDANVEECS